MRGLGVQSKEAMHKFMLTLGFFVGCKAPPAPMATTADAPTLPTATPTVAPTVAPTATPPPSPAPLSPAVATPGSLRPYPHGDFNAEVLQVLPDRAARDAARIVAEAIVVGASTELAQLLPPKLTVRGKRLTRAQAMKQIAAKGAQPWLGLYPDCGDRAPCDEYPWGAKQHEDSPTSFLLFVSASNHYDSYVELRFDGKRWWLTKVADVDWRDD